MEEEVEFSYLLAERDWPREDPLFKESDENALFHRIGEGLDPDVRLEYRIRPVPMGFDAVSVVISVAIGATALVGGVFTWLEVAKKVAATWRKVRARHGPPNISLNTAKLLTAVDLASKLGDMHDVELVWGTESRGLFLIVFRRGTQIWSYLVGRRGERVHYYEGQQPPADYSFLGRGTPDTDQSFLLDE